MNFLLRTLFIGNIFFFFFINWWPIGTAGGGVASPALDFAPLFLAVAHSLELFCSAWFGFVVQIKSLNCVIFVAATRVYCVMIELSKPDAVEERERGRNGGGWTNLFGGGSPPPLAKLSSTSAAAVAAAASERKSQAWDNSFTVRLLLLKRLLLPAAN